MKIHKPMILAILIALASLTVSSQIYQVTNTITIEEPKTCNIIFYDEFQEIYGTCTDYYNYTYCLNISGPNTDCSLKQTQNSFKCKTGELVIKKNSTECKPLNKFIILVNKGSVTEKKEIDFSNWGACIYSNENNCLIVTCVSNEDGAFKGQFTDCKGGKSCQKFQICKDGIKVFYKNSREDFVEQDPTFHLSQLAYKEVGQ